MTRIHFMALSATLVLGACAQDEGAMDDAGLDSTGMNADLTGDSAADDASTGAMDSTGSTDSTGSMDSASSGSTDETSGSSDDGSAGCSYPEGAVEPMALDSVLWPYSWPEAISADGTTIPLDLNQAFCDDDPNIEWSPHDVLVFISLPAW